MKDGAVLVNPGRGALVVTDALLRETQAGRLRAILDVTDPEPLPAEHPLWSSPGVTITPHVAGNTEGAMERAWTMAVQQIGMYARGAGADESRARADRVVDRRLAPSSAQMGSPSPAVAGRFEPMGELDEAALDRLIAAGCSDCGGTTLTFETYVDGVIPFLGGEPVGRVTWAYDGEKFVDGVYAVTCAGMPQAALRQRALPALPRARGPRPRARHAESVARPDGVRRPRLRRRGAPLPGFPTRQSPLRRKARRQGAKLDRAARRRLPRRARRVPRLPTDSFRSSDRCPLCAAPGPLRARPG